jgi:tRNA A-37 threonylcarbamoyl transferase component Bud32
MIFSLEFLSENFKRETKIDSIFENLKELVQRMLIGRNSKGQTDYNSRPNCEGILVKKNNWSLDLHELEIDESLKEIDKNLEFKMKFQNSLLLKYMKYLKSKIKPEIFNSRLKEEFSVFEELGAGCFGRVYKAQHKLDKQIYAIKKIDVANFYWEKEFTSKRATKEIAIMAKIQSDYIVHYITSWIERQVVYIQMEFCDENLDETIRYIKNYLLSKNKRILSQIGFCIASEIFKQINKGLQFLHEHNPPIIHRDLKPFNILLKYDGRKKFIRIADFAIATYHKYDGQLHMQDVGTINYMAPEVESGNYDTRADIYSLGRILKELFVIDFNR